MKKTFVGRQLRQLRQERNETQTDVARTLGVTPAYINMLENNQRSLSVKMLMALSDAYHLDWKELVRDDSPNLLADVRNVVQDPIFGSEPPDLHELRAAVEHSPRLVNCFVQLYKNHRTAVEKVMRQGEAQNRSDLVAMSPEATIHDFFRNHSNYFHTLEEAAERLRRNEPCGTHDVYATLKKRLQSKHGIAIQTQSVEAMDQTLRIHDRENSLLILSEALDHQNRVFQLIHVICLLEMDDLLNDLTKGSGIRSDAGHARCRVELANYFAAAYLMPYEAFLQKAEKTLYDVDRIAAAFGVSFEQVCHRLTTLQRPGATGVPLFFLRIDKAGNVTKRFNATSFNLAEYGGACPVWNIHTAFRTPGVVLPQFVELPGGEKFFTISRTTDRPVYSRETQNHRLAVALGCEFQYADRIGYASSFNLRDQNLFNPIGINCYLCPRKACSQRAHQPFFVELPIDPNRRGNTRYES
ncbi:short-chain fatty acyl-CoA regulator family protein [Pelagibius sp. Alg239-R121]|uniref:helix-turn-helix domain-containing protein n=1 Tax=Pelagibius sp. Alg239-R121 TaxID=2993448 RepID=UPI0024A67AD6|nr:helix-turn-helix transcriptional regulator [Pelagibius sp. Alg239-R121]